MTPTAVPSVAPSASERSSLGGTVGIVGTECQLDEAGLLVGIQVMELDYRVGVCFAENVRVEGNVRLWADGFELEMTEESRALWFDRSEYPSAFYVLDWRRDPELGERVTLAASGEEIVYELPDLLIMRLTNEYVAPVSAPVYELRIEHASMATDRFVVGISGIEDRSEKFFMQVSDPFGYDGCRADSGVLFAPAIADERLRYSATFIGYMNACISSGGRYFPNPPYEIEAFLLDRGATVVHSQVFSSDEFDVDLSAMSVSYGEFGERLLEEINAARAGEWLPRVMRRA